MNFAVPADRIVTIKEREKRDKYLDIAREQKKNLWNTKMTVISVRVGPLVTIPKVLVKGLEDLKNQRTSKDKPDYSIIKTDQNTEKSP